MTELDKAGNLAEDLLHLLQEAPETNLTKSAKLRCLTILKLAGRASTPSDTSELVRLAHELSQVDDFDLSNNDPLPRKTIFNR
jgi:hypothetical protein